MHDRAAWSRAATAYGSQLAASLAGRGWSVNSGGTEETDVLRAAAGYRYATATSLNWQGDVAPDAGFNPLRYAREMAGARRLLASRKHGCDTRQPPPSRDHVRPGRSMSKTGVTTAYQNPRYSVKFRDSSRMDLSYCRVSTTAQDLTRQIDAMRAAGIAEEHIYVDKRTGATMDRDGLTALLGFARPGDRINLLTLDRLGRNMREP